MADEKDTKQAIVVRKDLNMRRGKEDAQCSHSSMAFLTRRMQAWMEDRLAKGLPIYGDVTIHVGPQEAEWIMNSYAKVTLQVEGEEVLVGLHEQALNLGLESHLIVDSGRTEFAGVPTKTCIAIGPDYVEKIDVVTAKLKLR
jgi:PTH2 family peptidyl-tRNA hydrolase